jgi:hypothetical protein
MKGEVYVSLHVIETRVYIELPQLNRLDIYENFLGGACLKDLSRTPRPLAGQYVIEASSKAVTSIELFIASTELRVQ